MCICTHKKTKCQVPLRPLCAGIQNIQAKEVFTPQSSATRKPEGVYSRNVYTGRLRPQDQPLTIYIPLNFFTKKVSLSFQPP